MQAIESFKNSAVQGNYQAQVQVLEILKETL